MNINPFLVLLALLIGFALTWFLVVRKVVREVPILRPVSTGLDAAAGVAGVAGAAGGAGLVGAAASGHVDAPEVAPEVVTEVAHPVAAAPVYDWAHRLEAAAGQLAGASEVSEVSEVDEVDAAAPAVAVEASPVVDAAAGAVEYADPTPVASGVDYDAEWANEDTSVGLDLFDPEPANLIDDSDVIDEPAPVDAVEEPEPVVDAVEERVVAAAEPEVEVAPLPVAEASVAAGLVGAGAAAAVRRAASVPAPADGSSPEGYEVKGDSLAKLYLLDSDADFGRARADIWFTDESAARDAGYAHYVRTPKPDAAARVAEPVVAAPVVAPVVAAAADAPVAAPVQETLVDVPGDASAEEAVAAPYGPGSAVPKADGSGNERER
ncbi:MAG TPA: hypothetical protein PLS37_04795 [Propioniciclava tarda]|nr:hypothetical protein [Propioniciclava tarda]